jgi:hypothetical protein
MRSHTVEFTHSPPALEGRITANVWSQAEKLVLSDCVTGEETQLSTQISLLRDSEYLYVGFEVQDSEIIASFENRDDPLYEEDVVEIFLAPGQNLHYYYEFNFSPRAVIFDAVILNDDGSADQGRGKLKTWVDWNCDNLIAAAHTEESGNWSVTVAIPFADLHFAGNHPPQPGDQWRANFCRIEYGLDETEYYAWSPPEILDFHTSEKFGLLKF